MVNSIASEKYSVIQLRFAKFDGILVKALENLGFQQLIKESTRISGYAIDHIYVNKELMSLNVTTQIDSAYYSDHDIITLHIPK